MTTRLTYAPKAYVFTKQANGTLLDLTPYVVSGEVVRNINQVSSATVELRNPYRIFTTPSAGVAFHPQDPITIYLERIAGFPVRVFTGYLDTTPYYQLQPGTVTLEASCTLKRLLYTFFDPSLPYINAFFEKYGWINTGSGSIIATSAFGDGVNQAQANSQAGVTAVTQNLNDGSFAKLLWAVLYDIGEWDDSNIWIEPLPTGTDGIVARMVSLMSTMDTEQAAASQYFTDFMTTIVGSGGQGTGGGTSGGGGGATVSSGKLQNAGSLTIGGSPISSVQLNNINVVLDVGVSLNAPTNALLAALYAGSGESGMGASPNTYSGTGGSVGVFQSEPGTYSDGTDLKSQANAFYTGGTDFQQGGAIACANRGDAVWVIANEVEANKVWDDSKQDSYAGRISLAECQAILAAYQKGGSSSSSSSASSAGASLGDNVGSAASQSSSTSSSSASAGSDTLYDVIVMGANALASSGCGYAEEHNGVLSDKQPTYDCSWSVSYVLYAAGLLPSHPSGFATGTEEGIITAAPIGAVSGYDSSPNAVNIFVKLEDPDHTYMEIGGSSGRYWGTTDGTTTVPGCGQWLSQGNTTPAYNASFSVYHIPAAILNQPAKYGGCWPSGATTIPSSGTGGTAGAGITGSNGGTTAGGSAASSVASNGSADAFVGELDFPSVEEQVTALLLGTEGKGLMMDQNLLPFVQQVCQASMRSFQSLPNGDFYAFYPDYFGEMGAHEPYWFIEDIEIISGEIDLTDDALATHVFAVGDNTWPVNDELLNELFSAGTISIFNAFSADVVSTSANNSSSSENTSGLAAVMDAAEANAFIQRFGARPLVQNYPQVRSPIFEMLLAYQQFMLAWSNQFVTPFTFTFMPEVFPGGKVAFPSHGLKMYVNQVTHTFDYTEGFTTTAQLSAPSLYGAENPDLPPNMVAAIAEPILKNSPSKNASNVQGSTPSKQTTTPTPTTTTTTSTNPFSSLTAPIASGIDNPFT